MNLTHCCIFLIFASVVPLAYAESHDGKQADQELVEIKISSLGDVHVKHVIKDADSSQRLKLIDGDAVNISAHDEEYGPITFTVTDDGMYVLLPPSEENMVVEYELLHELVQNNEVWTMDFSYDETVSFLTPEGLDLIFVNGKPVYLGDKNGIKCHGCNMLLEYIVDEPRIFEDVVWEEDEFLVEIRTLSGIGQFEFDQPTKSIRFEVDDGNSYVTAIIPKKLLGDPYSVFLDDEKIYFHEYINNGTHVWLNTKPDSGGVIEIIGTTVIPEFSLMIPLIAGLVLAAVISRFKMSIPR